MHQWKMIIIYHNYLPTPRRGSHVKSDKTHTVIKIHPLAHILDSWASIFSSCALFSLSKPYHVKASIPSPCDNHQSMGEWSERTQEQAKMAAWNLFSYLCTRALHSFRSFTHCRAASTIISLLPKATFTPNDEHKMIKHRITGTAQAGSCILRLIPCKKIESFKEKCLPQPDQNTTIINM